MANLKPCPFCGNDSIDIDRGQTTGDLRVRCDNCGVSTGYLYAGDAIEAWNRREGEPLAKDGIYLVRTEHGILALAEYESCRGLKDDTMTEGWAFFGDSRVIPDAEFSAKAIAGPLQPIDCLKLCKDIREGR